MDWKKFGENIKSGTGVSLATLFVLVLTHGNKAVEIIGGIPILVNSFATNLPLGFWSGVIGTTLAAAFHMFARSWHKRSFSIELASIFVGLTAVMVQQVGGTSSDVLSAAAVGLVAGFGGLFTSKMLRAIFVKEKKDESTRPDQTLPDSD